MGINILTEGSVLVASHDVAWTAADDDSQVDWESPAGRGAPAVPRVFALPYIFEGPGDGHWIGQRCDILVEGTDGAESQAVVLSCGCRARVPRSSLRRVARPLVWLSASRPGASRALTISR